MDYPKTFNVCPVCGSTEKFGETVTQEEIEKGNLSEDSKTAIMLSKTMIFDPQNNQTIIARRQVPVLVGIFDVCCSCGALYCTEMRKEVGIIEPQIRRSNHPGEDTLPFFGRG